MPKTLIQTVSFKEDILNFSLSSLYGVVSPIDVMKNLLHILKQKILEKNKILNSKSSNTLFVIKIGEVQAIFKFLHFGIERTGAYVSENNFLGTKSLALICIEILDFLRNNYNLINDRNEVEELAKVLRGEKNLGEPYVALIRSLLKEESLVEEALREYLAKYMEFPSAPALKNYKMLFYYSALALFFSTRNELSRADAFAKKAMYYLPFVLKEGHPIGATLADAFKNIYTKAFQSKAFKTALYYAKLSKEYYQEIDLIYADIILQEKFNYRYVSKETLLSIKKQAEKSEDYLIGYLIPRCKKELFEQNLKELQTRLDILEIVKEDPVVFSVTFTINAKIDCKILKQSLNYVKAYFVIDGNECSLNKFYKLDIHALTEKYNNYLALSLQQIACHEQRKQENVLQMASVTISDLSPSEGALSSADRARHEELNKKSKKEKAAKPVTSIPVLGKEETITAKKVKKVLLEERNADVKEVYELYGDTAQNQFLVISKEFLEKLKDNKEIKDESQRNRIIKNLFHMGERGKILGKSTQRKGLIIKGDKIKGKDASKGYRFFGTVTHRLLIEGTNVNVFSFDSFKYKHAP